MNALPDAGERPTGEQEARGCSAEAPPPCKRRVLLVDDEENILASLRRLLRREDYELITANCGSEALELLEANPVQLIISDHRMPGMTGVELLREVRVRWPDTLRIILSGYSEVRTIIAAINEGEIYKFITKPWNDEEIKLHVRRALEQHELEEENRRMACEIAAQNDRLRELNVMLEQRAADASTGLTSTQDLLETIGVGVVTIDPAGLVVGANRRGSEIVSSGRSELIGIPAEVAFPKSLYELACTAAILDGAGCPISSEVGDSNGHRFVSPTAKAMGHPPGAECPGTADTAVARAGRLAIDGQKLQCRVSPLIAEGNHRGNVIALWEEVV